MMVRAGYRVRRCLGVLFATLCAVMLTAQVVVMPDSMYFRMVDEATATKAMRFDLTAYRDTLGS